MATWTLDLPEAPRAQAACRLATDCPCCGTPLGLRQHGQTETLLMGCSAYPGAAPIRAAPLPNRTTAACRPEVQVCAGLSRRWRHRESKGRLAQRQLAAERATLDRNRAAAHGPRLA
jgi:ssDNA-binding Zn-finger/Zn-ribbon topoisomerase 1